MSDNRFGKPDIEYQSGRINSEKFGVPPYYKYYCEYHETAFPDEESYVDHMVEYHPDVAEARFGDLKPFEEENVREQYPPEERERIDNVIDRINDINENLDDLEERLEDDLSDFRISYDKDDYPKIHQAHVCPRCGCPGANDITWEDIKKKREMEKEDKQSNAGVTSTDNTAKEVISESQMKVDDMIKMMLISVFTQIMIWALEYLYSLLKPLENVPFIEEIPKFISNAIDDLKEDQKESFNRNSRAGGSSAQVPLPGGGSMDLGQNIVGFMGNYEYTTCLEHYDTFSEDVEELLKEEHPDKQALNNIHKSLNNEKVTVDTVSKLVGTVVDEGYRSVSNNSLPRPERGESVPGTHMSDIDPTGGDRVEGILDETELFIDKLDGMFKEWFNDEGMLCCFIYNFIILWDEQWDIEKDINAKDVMNTKYSTSIGMKTGEDTKGVKENLNWIKSILKVWLILLMTDHDNSVRQQGNLMVDLIEEMTFEILKQYISLMRGSLSEELRDKWFKSLHIVQKYGENKVLEKCPPFNDFINIIPGFIEGLSGEVNKYLRDLISSLKVSSTKGNVSLDRARNILTLNKFIEIIDGITAHIEFWVECREHFSESPEETGNDLSAKVDGLSDSEFKNDLQDIYNSTTSKKMKGVKSLDPLSEEEIDRYREAIESGAMKAEPVYGPISKDGMKVLLTNILDVKPEVVEEAFEGGESICKGAFKPSEIKEIRGLFE